MAYIKNKQLFDLSEIGVLSFLGIHIGMSKVDLCRILDNNGIKYSTRRLREEPLSDFEIKVNSFVLSDKMPPCELFFALKYGESVSFIKVGLFYCTINEAKSLFNFFIQQIGPLNLFSRGWDNLDKDNESLRYFYNWSQSVEITLKEYFCQEIRQNPVSLIIRAHESPQMVAEVVRISKFLKNANNHVDFLQKTKNSFFSNIGFVLLLFIAACLILLTAYQVLKENKSTKSSSNSTYNQVYLSEQENNEDWVYICTGSNARKYHSTPSCRWLENCSEEIEEVTLFEAEGNGREPCKVCY